MRIKRGSRPRPHNDRSRHGKAVAAVFLIAAVSGPVTSAAVAQASSVPSPGVPSPGQPSLAPSPVAGALPSPTPSGAAGLATPPPAKPGAIVPTVGVPSALERQMDLAANAIRLRGLTSGGVPLRDAYAGVSLTPDRSAIDLWLTRDAPVLLAAAAAFVPLDYVHVHAAARSYATLDALTTRVARDVPTLDAAGVYVTNAGPNEDRNVVLIGVRGLTPAKASLIQIRYGDAAVAVAGSESQATSRQADYQPWWGGDVLGNDRNEGNCTLGPAFIKSDGSRYSVTAGHCFSLGSNLTNNYNYLGTVTSRYPYDGQLDAELMPVDAGNYIWRTDNGAAQQSGARNASRNSMVCKSGISTNEVCNVQVTQLNQMVQNEYGVFLHQDFANKNALVVAPGDSGGPVYMPNADGTVTIAGVTSSGFQPYSYCDRCSKQFSFTEYTYVAAGFGVSIL